MSSNQRLENYELAKQKLEEYSEKHLQPEPLVTGADLIGMGYSPVRGSAQDSRRGGRRATRRHDRNAAAKRSI